MYTPVDPSLLQLKWGVGFFSSHGHVIMIDNYSSDNVTIFKGTPITKALTCMKIYLYKQKWQFGKESYTSGCFVV